MKISIQGVDYSAALDASQVLTIDRKLNEPSSCQFCVAGCSALGLTLPKRFQTVAVINDTGIVLFTGFVVSDPVPQYAGMGYDGPSYVYGIQAVSEEWLYDQASLPWMDRVASSTLAGMLDSLILHAGISGVQASATTAVENCNALAVRHSHGWVRNASAMANEARSSYRVLNGTISVNAIPVVVHSMRESDGSLNVEGLGLTHGLRRNLANDITVCGKHEPVAYVTEYFLGDGATTTFNLSEMPFFEASADSKIVVENFDEASINTQVWSLVGVAEGWTISSKGLSFSGGNGIDGETLIALMDSVEVGGSMLLEATGVTVQANGTGVIAGLFHGEAKQTSCALGFSVTTLQGNGSAVVQPLILGSLAGSSYTLKAENSYTLRIRIHCQEHERSRMVYRVWGDDGQILSTPADVDSPAQVVLEIEEYVNTVGSTPVTLYSGAITNLPGNCSVVPVSCISMAGTMRRFSAKRQGSGWVESALSGSTTVRRLGTVAEGGECHLERDGKLIFYTGYAPASERQIAVSYRTSGRSVGRAVDSASQAALQASGIVPQFAWCGSVTSPAPRTSADCRNAASVLVQAASSASSLWSGSYTVNQFQLDSDVWPGDALELIVESQCVDRQVVVREVTVSYGASAPDLIRYKIHFANDWANDLAIKTSDSVHEDAWLPAKISPTVLANLNALTVSSVTSTVVSVDAGIDPPAGGGFEVRRRDFAFMPGEDDDLVLRSSTRSFTFSRESACDRFYIRAFDAATPPNYSEFSTALFINLPVSS